MRGIARRHEQGPDAVGLCLGLQILDDLDDLPAVARGILFVIGRDGGSNLALDELAHAALPMLLPVGEVEIHLSFLSLRSEEHTSELQSLMRISYAVFCLKNKNTL